MGRLIPAGTGMARYQRIGIQIEAPEVVEEAAEPAGASTGGGSYTSAAEGMVAAPGSGTSPIET